MQKGVQMKINNFEEIKNKVWPKTKKELEKAIEKTKKAIDTGERYLKTLSQKGVENTHKIALTLKREKLYYELGRTLHDTPKNKWLEGKKIDELIEAINEINKDIGNK